MLHNTASCPAVNCETVCCLPTYSVAVLPARKSRTSCPHSSCTAIRPNQAAQYSSSPPPGAGALGAGIAAAAPAGSRRA